MCGIFGYIGTRTNAPEMILDGLKGLEYRGYDSWGIAVKVEDKIEVDKHVGKIGDAKTKLDKSNIGIGHTRWATHGGVTVENAHPHLDCSGEIAVLHNGIIENFKELKEELIKKGHIFKSETDTEVVPHMIEDFIKGGKTFSESVLLSFKKLKGLSAIVAINTKFNQIIAAKNGSPLIIGIGDKEFFVASDASEVLNYTNNIIFLEDHQMVVLDKSVKIFDTNSTLEIKPKIEKINWKFEESHKGKFPHFLIKEIFEQPKILENLALNSGSEIKELANIINKAHGTFMLGCGTASYAALAGVYLFSQIAKKHVNFSVGSEFSYLEDYLNSESLLMPISQSGETIDIVEPIEKAKKKGVKIAAITNVLGSTLYRQADFKFLLNAGPEKAVIGTKSFTAMIAVLILCAYAASDKAEMGIELIKKSAINVSGILNNDISKIKKLVEKLVNKEHIYVLGRGLSYATALETTLKIKETTYTHAEGFAAGELKHGVISLIEKGTPCIIIAPNDTTYHEIISNAQEVKARGGYIIGIGPRNNDVFDFFLETADIKEATMIPQVVVSQLLAYELALKKGISDPDKPRNLAKSVTVK